MKTTRYNKINSLIRQQERHRVFLEENLSIVKENVASTNKTLSEFKNNINNFKTELDKLLVNMDKQFVEQNIKQYLTSIATLILNVTICQVFCLIVRQFHQNQAVRESD